MAALELRVLEGAGENEGKADGDAGEQRYEPNGLQGRRRGLGPAAPGHEQRHSSENGEHAPGDLPRKGAHVLVVAAHILRRPTGGLAQDGGTRLHSGGGRAGRQIALHKVVQRHVEYLAQLQQLVHFGIGLLGLPLRDGLTADAEHEGQLFLGHRMGSAKMLKVITEAHGGPTFSERGKAAALCFRAPRRNPCHQSSPSPKDKFG